MRTRRCKCVLWKNLSSESQWGDVEGNALRGVCGVVNGEGETRRRQIQRWSSVCSSRVSVLVPQVRDPRPSCRRVCGDASRVATHLRGCSASLPPRRGPAFVVQVTLPAVPPTWCRPPRRNRPIHGPRQPLLEAGPHVRPAGGSGSGGAAGHARRAPPRVREGPPGVAA